MAENDIGAARFAEALVASSPQALIALGADGRVLHWNWGAELMFGYPPGAAIGRALAEVVAVPGRPDGLQSLVVEALETGSAVLQGEMAHQSGALLNVEAVLRRVDDGAGAWIAATMKDLT